MAGATPEADSAWVVVEVTKYSLQPELNTLSQEGYNILNVLPQDAGGSEITYLIIAYR